MCLCLILQCKFLLCFHSYIIKCFFTGCVHCVKTDPHIPSYIGREMPEVVSQTLSLVHMFSSDDADDWLESGCQWNCVQSDTCALSKIFPEKFSFSMESDLSSTLNFFDIEHYVDKEVMKNTMESSLAEGSLREDSLKLVQCKDGNKRAINSPSDHQSPVFQDAHVRKLYDSISQPTVDTKLDSPLSCTNSTLAYGLHFSLQPSTSSSDTTVAAQSAAGGSFSVVARTNVDVANIMDAGELAVESDDTVETTHDRLHASVCVKPADQCDLLCAEEGEKLYALDGEHSRAWLSDQSEVFGGPCLQDAAAGAGTQKGVNFTGVLVRLSGTSQ